MVTRRTVLKGAAAFAAGTMGLASYAFGIEPIWRLHIASYRITPPGWPAGLRLRAVVIADLHAGAPQMTLDRVNEIVARANAFEPDVHFLLGDYGANHRWLTRRISPAEWAPALGRLKAPLGVHAVLGNHDWWDDKEAQQRGSGPVRGRTALEAVGIPVYENDVVRLAKQGQPFWIAGLGDQIALRVLSRRRDLYPAEPVGPRPLFDSAKFMAQMPIGSRAMFRNRVFNGVDDLPGTLAKVTDDAPVILIAHEPDVFVRVPDRVALTVCGHTHGGQVRLLGYSPLVPSIYGNRFAYGHIVEDGRNLIVSGGLGCSMLPVRLGVPPEIVVLDIGGATA